MNYVATGQPQLFDDSAPPAVRLHEAAHPFDAPTRTAESLGAPIS